MPKRAVATLALLLAPACGELPSTPAADAEARAHAAPANRLVLSSEQAGALTAMMDDARVRVLPGLGHDGLERALARVDDALARRDRAELDAAVTAALASLDEVGAQGEPAAELDLIRLALADVTLAAHPAPELAQ